MGIKGHEALCGALSARERTTPPTVNRGGVALRYLPFWGGRAGRRIVSTTWVEGLALAVLTGTNRPVDAFRPILGIRSPDLVSGTASATCLGMVAVRNSNRRPGQLKIAGHSSPPGQFRGLARTFKREGTDPRARFASARILVA